MLELQMKQHISILENMDKELIKAQVENDLKAKTNLMESLVQ